MKQLWEKCWDMEAFRYLFFGGCTTALNLAAFAVLRYAGHMPVNIANLLSIIAAIVFAFFVNRFMVFRKGQETGGKIALEFLNFSEMRFGTLGIEFFGVIVLNQWMELSDFFSKLLIQIVVIVLNYIISKFVIFRDRQAGGVANE